MGHIARSILRDALRGITGIIVTIAGATILVTSITVTIAGAARTIVDHVAFIHNDHHRVILGGEGPD